MAKVTQYHVLVNGKDTVVNTVREVSDVLGRKVSRVDIEAGKIPEITGISSIDAPYGAWHGSNGELIPGKDPLNRPENMVDNSKGENLENIINEEDIEMGKGKGNKGNKSNMEVAVATDVVVPDEVVQDTQEEVVDETAVEDTQEEVVEDTQEEDVDQTADEDTEDANEDNDSTDDTDNNDNEETPSLNDLLAKMAELRAKKEASEGSKDKGKRTKKIEFTGEYPEVGTFKEEKELKKFYKQLSDEQLDEWLELEGLTYKASDNEPINRMRKCMSILALHFPKDNKSSKKKSKYADYSTEELLEIALANDVDVPEGKGDARILRMYTIMALRKAKLLD